MRNWRIFVELRIITDIIVNESQGSIVVINQEVYHVDDINKDHKDDLSSHHTEHHYKYNRDVWSRKDSAM